MDHAAAQRPDAGPNPATGSYGLPWALGLLGCLATFAGWQLLLQQEARAIEARFQLDAAERALVIQERFEDGINALHAVRAFYAAADRVRGDQYSALLVPILDRHPYVQAIGWNPLVTDVERNAFEAEMRASGWPDYRITERTAQGEMAPAARRDVYVPVRFIEPLAGNEEALGFDTASEPSRREALTRARETGRLAVSSRITLVQEHQRQYSVLAYLPVFGRGSATAPGDGDGFVVGVLRAAGVVESALAAFDPVAIDIVLTDESAPVGARCLFLAGAGSSPSDGERLLEDAMAARTPMSSRSFNLGGREWKISFVATEAYLAGLSSRAPLGGLLTGLALTLLATAYLARSARHTARVNQLVAQRAAAESALVENEERLRLTLEAMTDGMWDWNIVTGEVLFSDSWIESLGYERPDVPGTVDFWENIVHPDDLPAVQTAVDRHLAGLTEQYECENRLRTKSGDYRWNLDRGRVVERDDDGKPLRMVGTDTNITERKLAEERQAKIEQQVQRTQKLESLGLLAGGIAHDFNNLLVAILGGTDLARHEVPETSPAHGHLELVETAAKRAADLIRQIHTYSGLSSHSVERLDLSSLVRDVGQLLETSVSKKARLRFELAEQLPLVEGDPAQLRQILINLLINASDALQGASGEVAVSTSAVTLRSGESESAVASGELEPGHYVRLEVTDTGAGMDDDVQSRIFDPFFTTKEQGQGLGLAVTQGVVRSHHGAVQVRSKVGRGTTISVLLPAAEAAEVPQALRAQAEGETWQASGTILVVDDKPEVVQIAERMLRRIGFEVLTAVDGQDGVESFARNRDRISLTMLDMNMPRMDGADAFREIRRLDPRARILLSSGYSERDSASLLGDDPRAGFVQKPYLMADLRATLQQVMGA